MAELGLAELVRLAANENPLGPSPRVVEAVRREAGNVHLYPDGGSTAVRDGLVYAGTSDSSRFMALDARTGRLRFNFDAKAYMFSSPALAGGLAYVGDHNGRLYAIDAKTGALAWEFQTPAAKADVMKVLQPDGSLNRDAFAPLFGDFQDMYIDFYRYISIGSILGSPAVDRGVVYIGSMDGNLYALQ